MGRPLVAALAAASLLVGGLAASAGVAQAAPLNVRGDSDQVHSFVTGVTSNFPNSGSSSENIESLRDKDATTKWYAGTGNKPTTESPIWAIYTLSSAQLVTGYSLTSGDDAPERDPKAWTVLGSNDAAAATNATHASWVQIDSRFDQAFNARRARNLYTTTAATAYKYYQLRVTANLANHATATNNTKFQISDWTLRTGQAGYSSNIITSGTQWQYLEDGTIDPANGNADRTAWTQVGASLPGTWKTAAGPFGAKRDGTAPPNIGIGANFPVTTVLKYYLNGTSNPVVPAYFFRYQFDLDQNALDSIRGLYGSLVHDDAATVYINGVNVADYPGANVPTGNLGYGGDNKGDPQTETLLFPATPLRLGTNVISIELHNVNDTSSDVYLSLSLAATSDTVAVPFTVAETSASYASGSVPSDFFSTLLTGFDEVKNEPTIMAPNSSGPNNGATLAAANDRVVVAVNNGATGSDAVKVAKRAQAIYDADNNSAITMTDALGAVLGPIYRAALTSGELPKTKWILDNIENSSYENANNAAKALWSYQRPMNRLGFVGGGTCSGGTFSGSNGWIAVTYSSQSGYNGLCTQGSFPSGHALHGYSNGTMLASLIPELSPQILSRASEYGNNRLVLGFHYPMDVMAGRINGQAVAANRWSDAQFSNLLKQSTTELRAVLGAKCDDVAHTTDLVQCAKTDTAFETTEHALTVYKQRLTYSSYPTTDGVVRNDGFQKAFPSATNLPVRVPATAPALLTTVFPTLTSSERATVLRATAIEGGYALDKTKDGGDSWQRLNIAAAMNATVSHGGGGQLIVNGVDTSVGGVSGVTVGGSALSGFSPSVTDYSVVLPVGTTTAPQIVAGAPTGGAGVRVTQATTLPGTATVTVTTLDGVDTTYSINFAAADAIAELSDLKVNGETITGFASGTRTYVVELPEGTTATPVVTATAASGGVVTYTQASSPNGTAEVKVTSSDGSTTATYVIQFTVKTTIPGPGGGDGGGGTTTVTASVSATVTSVAYNTPAKVGVTVTAKDVVPAGTVVITEGNRSLGSASLSAGKTTVTLPRTLTVGTHKLTVRYLPAAGGKVIAPSSPTSVTLVVKKAKAKKPTVTITKGKRNKTTIKRNVKATLKITLKAVGAAAPTGKVTVKVGKKSVGSAKVRKVGKKYVATVKTKKLTKKGKVSVVYTGNKSLSKATYSTKVRVK
ncbi:hypothetical protein GCM10010401_22740 [Rarobacter faecitabidus]|uniref:Ig-like domain-containing protein n=2 Tax=Rarobacter faecitabidus TaxID=13243 RepID=A0A542ZW63_RARFA|nr:Ig-like domain-containing protein [Rarobacter faecitabidus]